MFSDTVANQLVRDNEFQVLVVYFEKALRLSGSSDSTIRLAISNIKRLHAISKMMFGERHPSVTVSDLEERLSRLNLTGKTFADALWCVVSELYMDVYVDGVPILLKGKKALSTIIVKPLAGRLSDRQVERYLTASKDIGTKGVVRSKTLENAALLEAVLWLTDGALIALLPQQVSKNKTNSPRRNQVPSVENFTGRLQKEWDNTVRFFTYGTPPALKPFNHTPGLIQLNGGQCWTPKQTPISPTPCVPSARFFHTQLKYFFGWLVEHAKVPEDDLSLSLLAYSGLIDAFAAYVLDKGEGGTKVASTYVLAAKLYRHPNSIGSLYFVPRQPPKYHSEYIDVYYPNGLPVIKSLKMWGEYREKLIFNLRASEQSWRRTIERQKALGMTPESKSGGDSNIKWLLKHPKGVVHAVDHDFFGVLRKLEQASQDDRYSQEQQDHFVGAAALYGLLFYRPLRISNMFSLQLLSAPPTDLVDISVESCWFDSRGGFHIYVPKNTLKNRRSREVESVYFSVDKQSLVASVTRKWVRSRSRLVSERFAGLNQPTNYLFVGVKKGVNGRGSSGLPLFRPHKQNTSPAYYTDYFTSAFYYGMRLHFGDHYLEKLNIRRGINAHGMRRVVAHYYLEKTDYDYQLVAHILMDKVEQIINTYGRNNHFQQSMKLKKIQKRLPDRAV